MLVKLTTGVDFTNILHEAFTSTDPKSAKKTHSLTVFFALLRYTSVKVVRKMLVKLTPAHLQKSVIVKNEFAELKNFFRVILLMSGKTGCEIKVVIILRFTSYKKMDDEPMKENQSDTILFIATKH